MNSFEKYIRNYLEKNREQENITTEKKVYHKNKISLIL